MDSLTFWAEAKVFMAMNFKSDDIKALILDSEKNYESKLKVGLLHITGKYKQIPKSDEDAFECIKDAALNKNYKAEYLYGQCLFNGIMCKEDKKASIEFFEDAAMEGIPEAGYDFAELLYAGEYTQFNPRRAAKYYKIAGDYGNIDAVIKYATICLKYEAPMRDYRQAALYFKMAAMHDEPEAQYGYGYCLKDGLGVPKNLVEAEKYLKKAEAANHNGAIYCLGELYEEEEKYDLALQYYKRGIEADFVPSYYRLGCMYEQGKGVQKDLSRAEQYKEYAVEQKHPEALMEYGMNLIKKDKDYLGGLEYIREAADLGYAEAQFETGKVYLNLNDYTTAAVYFKKAADNDVAKAQYSYAYILKTGNCGRVNEEEIMNYYQKAADNGVPKALYGMGLMYESGSSFYPQNYNKAAQLFQQAAEKGVAEAMLKFGEYALEGKGVNQNEQIGLLYIKKSADAGYPPAQYIYAKKLEDMDDEVGAFKYHKMAALNNVPESQYYAGCVLINGQEHVAEKDTKTAAAFLLGAAQNYYENVEDEF